MPKVSSLAEYPSLLTWCPSCWLRDSNSKRSSSLSNSDILLKLSDSIAVIILFSKLFEVDYDKKASYLGITKFNRLSRTSKNLIPLGGIKIKNLNKLKNLYCEGIALLSEIKKKPTKIISRLF